MLTIDSDAHVIECEKTWTYVDKASQALMPKLVTEADGDYYIDEYTCPFPKTAERDRAVCALHVDFVRILSGDDARLTRSLLRGERACTYRIRPSAKRGEEPVAVVG